MGTPKIGDLQVWWIPQIPGDALEVPVASVEEGVKLMDILADYDAFQFLHHIKPDYSNAGGLQCWKADCGDGAPGWVDWYDEESGDDDPKQWLEEQGNAKERARNREIDNRIEEEVDKRRPNHDERV